MTPSAQRLQIQWTFTKFYVNASYNEAASSRTTGGPAPAEGKSLTVLRNFRWNFFLLNSFFFFLSFYFCECLESIFPVKGGLRLLTTNFRRKKNSAEEEKVAKTEEWHQLYFSLSVFLLFSSFLCRLTVVLWGSLGAMGQSELEAFRCCGTCKEMKERRERNK